ncbi:hypothetical protein [Gorillibacterium timonense]|uniref:hypothetical protein n=1 Tax=Gorillibacterium timonense TaxID=1689269 RepID=UPI00071CEA19|nr:hypothetical protein [Gorillibacterium timonense]
MTKILVLVERDSNHNKYLPIIKKTTNLGLSEIKNRIDHDIPILETVLFKDEDGDERLKELINGLTKLAARVKLFDGEIDQNHEVTIDYLMNRFDRFSEIQQQNERIDDFMNGDDV